MSRARKVGLALLAAGGCLLIGLASGHRAPLLLFNTTRSAPLGFYWLTPGRFSRGQLVAVAPPVELARWMATRHYLPINVPLLKEIVATEGQIVCGRGDGLSIDGVVVAHIRSHDRWGRALPAFRGCRRLSAGQVFLLNRRAPNSLDGRYFGPLPIERVIGGAHPLWTWERAS
ncbi:S26 family signal peptidase [Caulobacter sp. BE254]|uniref:S26 family signal peptidase n=1 Tax=Caulobacter sp. BE254 TaxID=2817720 RepID=UPI002863F615|nr:S26 family signal peptidase [Caulobacter sp. BE254]MDR7117363.1 conjugative transfer signal peptidase TraF [Caulobacter sp. BE254]